MTQRKLTKALQAQKSKTQQTIQEYYGTLGTKLNGEQLVNVPERSNYVYVKMRDNPNEVIQAFNNAVATSYDLPVILRREGTRYSVLGVNTARYQNTWNVVAPYLPNHGNTHSFSDSGGGDVSWIFSRQFLPALVYPTSVTTGTNVFVGGYNLLTASNVWKYVGNTGTLDLLSYKPTGSIQSQMVLIYLDTITGNPGVLTSTGSYLYNYITGSAQVLPYIPAPSLPSSQIPLAGVRLDTGTMSISWDNLYDIRQWIHAIPSGTSSGGGSGVDTIGFAGLAAGVPLGTGTMLNVVGAGATFTRSGTMFNLNIPGGGGGVDQIGIYALWTGTPLGTGTRLNVVGGSGVTFTVSGTTLNLNIPGGDVFGPASGTAGDLVSFNGTNGKLIKDSGLSTVNVADAVSLKHLQGSDTGLGALNTKYPPIGADMFIFRDSTLSDALVTVTWAQIQSLLVTSPAYIDGLNVTYSSSGTIIVNPGSAYIPSLGRTTEVTGSITVNIFKPSSTSSGTFTHVYLYEDGSGIPTIQVTGTAPSNPYSGVARTKTGDTTMRYIGSLYHDTGGYLYRFASETIGNVMKVNWIAPQAATAFEPMASGTSATNPATLSINYLLPNVGIVNEVNVQPIIVAPAGSDFVLAVGETILSSAFANNFQSAEAYTRYFNGSAGTATNFFQPSSPIKISGSTIQYMTVQVAGSNGWAIIRVRGISMQR